MNTPKYLVIHHEAPPKIVNGERFNIVDQYHRSLGWAKIGYHYFIEKTGAVKQGRLDNESGAHTKSHNEDSLGICLAGNFDLEMPTSNQLTALKNLCKAKMAQYSIPLEKVVPHRYFATYSLAKEGNPGPNKTSYKTWDNTQPYKSCFGSKLTDQWIKDLLGEEMVTLTFTIPKLKVALLENFVKTL